MNKSEINEIIKMFEQNIEDLKKYFLEMPSEHFLSEKELHSYFYHLCRLNSIFEHDNLFLIRSEYPTPFKCSKHQGEPFFEIENIYDNKSRSHIDIVLYNPCFIDFCKKNFDSLKSKCRNLDLFDILSGVKNEVYSGYIKNFIDFYFDFVNKYEQPIILYALEFKYLRHGSLGTMSPPEEIKYDIKKLRKFRSFRLDDIMKEELWFCSNIKSLIFCNNRIKEDSIEKIKNEVINYFGNSEHFEFIRRQ